MLPVPMGMPSFCWCRCSLSLSHKSPLSLSPNQSTVWASPWISAFWIAICIDLKKMFVAFHFERAFSFRLSKQSWEFFFFNWMERTLISGHGYDSCVMVSDVRVVQWLSDSFVLNCLKSCSPGCNDMPSGDSVQTNWPSCYLKTEALNFGSIVRLSHLIFSAMSLWH